MKFAKIEKRKLRQIKRQDDGKYVFECIDGGDNPFGLFEYHGRLFHTAGFDRTRNDGYMTVYAWRMVIEANRKGGE